MRTLSCAVIAATMILMGCSKKAAGDAPATDAPASATAPAAPGDACGLLSLSEIRKVLPQAERSQRNDALLEHGVNACGWYANTGKASVLDVSVWQVSGPDDTAMNNASTLSMGIADPLRSGAQDAVRLEKIPGVGEEAVAIVEKADEARGILSTGVLLTLQKNGRIATVASGFIAVDDRQKALAQLTQLGKAVAARL